MKNYLLKAYSFYSSLYLLEKKTKQLSNNPKCRSFMKSLTNLSDQQLIHLYMDGDAESLSTLVLRYKDKIYTSIYLLVKDKYLAEDIFQDSFIRIIDTLKTGRYTDEGKFLPWAMRIAHNLCVDHFRKVKRTPAISLKLRSA